MTASDEALIDRTLRFAVSVLEDEMFKSVLTEAERSDVLALASAVVAGDIRVVQAERLQAADSDGLAQAVCRALSAHVSHGGSIPWPSVRKPYEEWLEVANHE